MSDFLPDWYDGGYLDVEDVICEYFSWLLGDRVYVCTWLPEDWYDPTSGQGTEPTLRIWRQPGRADGSLRTDESLVQIAAITRRRSDSWRLSDFVRRMMDDEVICGLGIPYKGKTVRLGSCEEWLGPQQVPEQFIDDKFIPVTFKLQVREPRGLPNYRQIVQSLPR
ncbi:tail terminator [Mycobacterium phage Kumao]|uniref:Tail terminator n=1 Tax=Mycobacterium phage Kumao TaxID=2041344 RepID=A0A2D1GPR1_9CAUD|nr:tail terminator [Mycobacterium phage Kumao]ATN93984.1 tail terminator [Mycobacterium phage Kumao]